MKTIRILSLAVLALTMAACTSDETSSPVNPTGEGIPFRATISAGAATRAITENTEAQTLETAWAVGEQVALVYSYSGSVLSDVMTVESVDAKTKAATITGTITHTPDDGIDATLIYPASAVDATTKAVKTTLLAQQDGTLATIAKDLDLRKGSATLKVGITSASLDGTATLDNQLAIVKFSLTDGTNALKTTKFVIKTGSDETANVLTTITPASAASDLYVAMEPATSQDYTFEATVGEQVYTYSKTGVTLAADYYYQSTVAMIPPAPTTSPGTITFSKATDTKTWSATAADNTYQLQATVTGDAVPTYSISDNTCGATIDASTGVVTFTQAGSVTVIATVANTEAYTYETKTASYTLTITKAAGSIKFDTPTPSQTWSTTASANTYQQQVTHTGNATVTYSISDNTCGATIDAKTGLVTFTKAGSVKVTATVADTETYTYATKTASYTLTVSKATGSIKFDTPTPSQTWSTTTSANTYQQQVTHTGNATVTYSISDNTCGATIDASTGVVTFTKAGSVKVTATVADTETYTYATKTASYTLTVSKAAGSISYPSTMTSVEKTIGDAAFTNTLTHTGDGTVEYTSSKTNVATVNKTTGEVTIVGFGTTTITATVTDGTNYTYATKTATYKVIVKASGVNPRDPFGDGGDPLQ